MSSAPESPVHQGPWSMPTNFLPVPKGYSNNNNTRIDISTKTVGQLRALAAKHNSRHGIKQDPFQTTLHGIPERAKLRPDSKVATTDSIGTLLPAESPYARAWRSIKRQVKAGKGDIAAKRAEAVATAARLAKLQSKHSTDPNKAPQRHIQQLIVPPEQLRWRSKLSVFLCRPVDLPQLAPGAPVLDMNKLFIEVMNKGGYAAVTAASGWPDIAFELQRDSELADIVQAVYQCYLHPLELDIPYGFRPARNIDHLDSRSQQRTAMGMRLSTYDAVAYAADTVSAAIQQAMPPTNVNTAALDLQQQVDTARSCSQLVHAAVQLLRDAALCADGVVEQLLQNGLLAALHKPSQEACIAQIKRFHSNRKFSRADTEPDDADEIVTDIKQDWAVTQAVADSTGGAKRRASEAATDAAVSTEDGLAAPEQDAAGGAQQFQQAAVHSSPTKQFVQSSAVKRVRTSSDSGIQQQQVSPAASNALHDKLPASAEGSIQPGEQQQLNAARWLLLSARAIRSGPPGCDKPLLWLPGMATAAKIDPSLVGHRRSSDGGSGKTTASSTDGRQRAFHGITPKCGQCKMCRNPSMKKACLVNKERIAKGLAPIMIPD